MRVLPTRALTDEVVAALADLPFPIGDGVAPLNGGWKGGSPNTGEFTPYAVVRFSGASDDYARSVGRAWGAWDITLAIGCYGGLRSQCCWVSDQVRLFMADTYNPPGVEVVDAEGDSWSLGGVRPAGVNGPMRTDEVDPPYWQTTDSYTLTYDLSRTSALRPRMAELQRTP